MCVCVLLLPPSQERWKHVCIDTHRVSLFDEHVCVCCCKVEFRFISSKFCSGNLSEMDKTKFLHKLGIQVYCIRYTIL